MKRIKFTVTTLAAGAAFALAASAAQAYPDKPITMLIGAGAGGSTDAGGRILAQAMEKSLGQSIVVVNKPGGGGSKALIQLKKEKPDGYTLAYAFSHHVTFVPQFRRKKPPYAAADFDYVGTITWPYFSIVGMAGKGFNTLDEMVKQFKAENKPIRMVYSGGPGRLIGEAISRGFNHPVNIIRVRGGGKSMQQILGGHVDIGYTGGAHTPYTSAGKMKILATLDTKRNPQFPDAPTFIELKIPATTPARQVLVAPKGVPADVMKKLSEAVLAARSDPNVIKLYATNLKMRMDDQSPAEVPAYMAAEEKSYGDLIKAFDTPDDDKKN